MDDDPVAAIEILYIELEFAAGIRLGGGELEGETRGGEPGGGLFFGCARMRVGKAACDELPADLGRIEAGSGGVGEDVRPAESCPAVGKRIKTCKGGIVEDPVCRGAADPFRGSPEIAKDVRRGIALQGVEAVDCDGEPGAGRVGCVERFVPVVRCGEGGG